MNHYLRHLPIIGLLALCLSTSAQTGDVALREMSLDRARALAGQADKLFFLYFSADWCMPCQWMEQHTFTDPSVTGYIELHYLAIRINIDRQENKQLAQRFQVSKLPTLLLFSAAGVLVDRREATLSANELLVWLQTHDQPYNHLPPKPGVAPAYQPDALADSPKPQPSFSRPPLLPDAETPPQPYEMPPSPYQVKPERPVLLASAPPSAGGFVPRQGEYYGVEIGDARGYEQAVREAIRLEEKYGRRTEIFPAEEAGRFRIVMGRFSTYSAAQELLIFLNRNDIAGSVTPLPTP